MCLFARQAKTASGATTAQTSCERGVVRTVVAHVGSPHNNAELAGLVAEASGWIEARQDAFDLDSLVRRSTLATSAPYVTVTRSRVMWDVPD